MLNQRSCGQLPWLTLAVVSLAALAPVAAAEEAEGVIRGVPITIAAPEAEGYWLGVLCVTVDPAVRAHLDLPEGHGVMIDKVVPESPAEKGGLQRYDILLEAGDTPIAKPEELVKAVENSEGKQITLELIRSGKKRSVNVTPEKQIGSQRVIMFQNKSDDASVKVLEQWVGRLKGKQESRKVLRLETVWPGMVVARSITAEFPDDLKIQIIKQGNKPAKIEVEQGDESWATTEDKLDKLPERVRTFVQQYLGRRMTGVFQSSPQRQNFSQYYVYRHPDRPKVEVKTPTATNVEKRLDQLERRLKEVLDEVRKLRADQPGETYEQREDGEQ